MKQKMIDDKRVLEAQKLALEEKRLNHQIEMEKKKMEEEIKEKEHQRRMEERREAQFQAILQLLSQKQ